mmetsp:Transcript_18029/g.37610  ORF Transcript_18029/g.37610 Transcript_18029/m.37610 type:complete len:355 (+) Transcript_18029:127-1191(+)
MASKMRSLLKIRNRSKEINEESTPAKSPSPAIPPISPISEGDVSTTSSGSHAELENVRVEDGSQGKLQEEEVLDVTKSSRFPKLVNISKRFGTTSSIKSTTGVPIITSFEGADHFSPSLVQGKNAMEDGYRRKDGPRPKVRPEAKASAFCGPVRYDWMDIETAAAIKVQAAYRRFVTLKRLDEQGLSTAGIRNRRRKRNVKSRMMKSEDVPFLFSLCGVGFIFGDGTFEDEKVVTQLEKKKKQELKQSMALKDAERRKFRMRKKESQQLEEGIEVVESFEQELEDNAVVENDQEKEEMDNNIRDPTDEYSGCSVEDVDLSMPSSFESDERPFEKSSAKIESKSKLSSARRMIPF